MESFEDANLKAALRRACGRETAPAQLRENIKRLDWKGPLADGDADLTVFSQTVKSSKGGFGIFRHPMWIGFAVAACVAIAIGVIFRTNRASALPVDIAANLIRTHDGCGNSKNHFHVQGDFAAIAQKLARDLKVPVISTAMRGWEFAGAGECGVWGHPSAHLLYRRGNQTLSIFSIPAADFGLSGHDQAFKNDINGHYLASFVKDNGLYSVVESATDGSAEASDAVSVRDLLRKNFSSGAVAGAPGNVVVASSDLH